MIHEEAHPVLFEPDGERLLGDVHRFNFPNEDFVAAGSAGIRANHTPNPQGAFLGKALRPRERLRIRLRGDHSLDDSRAIPHQDEPDFP